MLHRTFLRTCAASALSLICLGFPSAPENAPAAFGAQQPSPQIIELWTGTPPGESAPAVPEKLFRDKDGNVTGITNVWKPTLEFHPAPAANNSGATVLVCPGGGYGRLAWSHEGIAVAEYLNGIGVNAAILKYRVPRRPAPAVFGEIALKDTQRALSLLRSNAINLKIDPARIGILGFSAGGHLAAITSVAPDRTYPASDDADKLSCRPNFTVLFYPAYMTVHGYNTNGDGTPKRGFSARQPSDALTPRVTPTRATPPAICFHSSNDDYTSDGSLLYYQALRKLGVPAELHIYATGGHGWGFKENTATGDSMRTSLAAWLKHNHWLTPASKPKAK